MHVHLEQRLEGVADIGEIVAGLAPCAAEPVEARGVVHSAGILRMRRVDRITDRVGPALRPAPRVQQMDGEVLFPVDARDQLAFAQIAENLVHPPGSDAERAAAASPAALEPENQTGTLRRAPVDDARNAQGAVVAVQPGRSLLDIVKVGTPHQGGVAEHPEVLALVAGHGYCAAVPARVLSRSP